MTRRLFLCSLAVVSMVTGLTFDQQLVTEDDQILVDGDDQLWA